MSSSKTIRQKSEIQERAKKEYRERLDRRLKKAINTDFNSACMSNSKWHKTLLLLAEVEYPPTDCRWKFVLDEKIYATRLPTFRDLGETRFEDNGLNIGLAPYSEIQWLEIIAHDAAKILDVLDLIGKFETEIVPDGLRIYGYR